MKRLLFGLPKGSLQQATTSLMEKAGFNIEAGARSYMPSVDDPELEVRLIRAQEISRYVESGILDAGITGKDWIAENGSDVIEVAELLYSKQGFRAVRWVLAVPKSSKVKSVKDLAGKTIATEAVNLTKRFLSKHGVKAEVEFSWGATEAKAPDLVDAIVELTETGASLEANNLRIIETVLESSTRLIAGKTAWADKWKQQKTKQIALLLTGALAAQGKVLLKLNVAAAKLGDVTKILPSLHAPTVSQLAGNGWVAVETVMNESVVRSIVPQLKAAGAEGIIELPLNKVIP